MLKPHLPSKFHEKTKRYVTENWGIPFIVGFMILLFSSAVLLAGGLVSTAENTATFAYFALVIGVVLQLLSLSKIRRRKQGAALHGSG